MATPAQEAEWRAEFERTGEYMIRADMPSGVGVGITDEPKRQFAFKWLREKERERALRETETHRYVKWTFWAALAAVGVGVVGVIVTMWH